MKTKMSPIPAIIETRIRKKMLYPQRDFCSSPEAVRTQRNSIVPRNMVARAMKA